MKESVSGGCRHDASISSAIAVGFSAPVRHVETADRGIMLRRARRSRKRLKKASVKMTIVAAKLGECCGLAQFMYSNPSANPPSFNE